MPSHLPKVQQVEQTKPIDLSGQSKKVLQIKSTLAEVKSPISKSGIFTKTYDTLIKMEKHLSKLRDFAAAKTDVKWNEKTGQYHATLDSNKMVPFSDPRVPEGATRAEPKLDIFETMGKEGSDGMLERLTAIEKNTKTTAEAFLGQRSLSAEEKMEEDAWAENRKKDLEKHQAAEANTLKGMWKSIKEGNKDNFFVKHWKKIAFGLALLLTPLKTIKTILDTLVGLFKWSAKHPLIAAIAGLSVYFVGKPLMKLLKAKLFGDKEAGQTGLVKKGWDKAKSKVRESGVGKAFKSRGVAGAAGHSWYHTKKGAKAFGGTMSKGVKTIGGGVKSVAGKVADKGGDWFKTLMGKFGKAGKFLVKLGKGVITGLMRMGPYGWAIIGGIALGSIVFAYWDDIKAGVEKVFGFLSNAASGIVNFYKGILGKVADMGLKLLRMLGLGFIADMFEGKDEEEDPNKPKKGFFAKVWEFIKGIPGMVLDYYKNLFKSVGKLAFLALKPFLPNWLADKVSGWFSDGKDDEKEETKKEKEPEGVEATPAVARTKDEKIRARANVEKLNTAQEEGGVLGMRDMGVDNKAEQILADMDTDDLRFAVTTAKAVGLNKKDPPLFNAMIKELKSRKMSKDDVEAKIMPKSQWRFSEDYKKRFREEDGTISGGNASEQEHEYQKYVEGMRGTAGRDLSKPEVASKIVTPLVSPTDKPNVVRVRGLTITAKMRDKWADHIGIKQRGKGGIAKDLKRKRAKVDLAKAVASGRHEEIQEVLGDKLYTQFIGKSGGVIGAAQGFSGIVKKPTAFLTGEEGPELVHITPIVSPDAKTGALNSIHNENATLKGEKTGAGNFVNAPSTNVTNNNNETKFFMPKNAQGGMNLDKLVE